MITLSISKFFGKFLFKKEAAGKFLQEYFADRTIKIYWLAGGAANVLLWLLAFLIWRGLHQDLAILHYNIIFGIDYLAPRTQIYFLPLIALILSLLNAGLSLAYWKRDLFLSKLLLAAVAAVNIIVGLGLYSIYIVNFVKLF